MGVGGTHDAGFEQSVVAIDTHERLHDERGKTQVLFRCLPWCVQQDICIGRQAPVVVLTAAIDAGKRFFVEQHAETMLACHAFHEYHQQHVVVHSEIGVFKDRRHLKLVGCHLVVACLTGDGQFQRLHLKVFHEGHHAVGNDAEVVVVHLLVLGRIVAHQRTACEHQVGAGRIEVFVDEEIFLFPA